ncbi:MAG: hypothetical protein E7284_10070 [Lachnospiraceae bacterium]|nr:hypothetical protein [Lachnospiraceae bacterium]
MPYVKEICVAGNTIEINKYYSPRYHDKGEKRAVKEKLTSEAQRKVNLRKAIKELRRLMNHNFKDGDYLVRLDFFRQQSPAGSEQMQDMMKKFIRKLRTQFRKRGMELKYIYVKEIGPRGGRHVHMMMSKCDLDIIRRCWPHGGIHVDPLNTNGQYRKIAEYFVKYSSRTEETEGRLIGKRWYGSRNLSRPQVTKRIISANSFRKQIRVKKGYILDKDSIVNGISEITGYEYFSYTLIKAEQQSRGG